MLGKNPLWVAKQLARRGKGSRRSGPTDRFRVRGTAHIINSVNGLPILVDAMEFAQ